MHAYLYSVTLCACSGNGRHSVSALGNVLVAAPGAKANGATVQQTFLYGPPDSGIILPPGSLPNIFTLCTMTRYNGLNRRRIMDIYGTNSYHGHQGGRREVISYNNITWTVTNSSRGVIDNWLVACAKNSEGAPNNALMDGVPVGVSNSSSITGNWQLGINTGSSQESSDFAFAHAMVWDEWLTDEEMRLVSATMISSLNDLTVSVAALGQCTGPTLANLIAFKPVYARWHAPEFNVASKTWNNVASIAANTVQKVSASGSGATASLTYINGTVTDVITFLNPTLPTKYTICSLTKYNGANRKRVITGTSTNFLLGHWGGNRGVSCFASCM
jgi:hypothetical protein